ncbi:two-component system sensor histidine kinase PhoQ [Serratia rhizosphaerae]|uniref:two-component system sensor histidine kinase PhoQ n=1 Tax=unclassified Serratia (in: enterobacteria) TaxID=2647522 RepID=UPI000CF69D8D|nr:MULTISPECIES: two-component system sensor histidine kinase PhoQ [unclassified Serratia (in: enterobacteria)]MBU3891243.1 two-component system sensor histidine kinase PhoQ [Serratia rubidaea]AVJ17310.1 two-component system sensor histidine kinase PhoQ [Serratia sp. MYb239]MCA4822271.1 two-component system sensor histidine kinase PhoQ [Serratia rubidaea]QNK30821.1 two-component system sensor histidine kinase PhoQ [Serratia sp. JUb9]CAE1145229.1 sensory histidine kinase in two-compoent regulat
MFNRDKKPFSLRARFLMATAGVILALSLSYGLVAVVGYIVSFDKTAFRLLRSESNLFFSLAQWKDQKLTIAIPPDIDLNSPTLVFIYDEHGHLLWSQRKMPELERLIDKKWLKDAGFYEIDTDTRISSEVLGDNPKAQDQLKDYDASDQNALTHSVAVNTYAATARLPALTIVVVDSIPQELQRSDVVWEWFSYVLLANLLLVVPLLWLAAYWSLRPIKTLIHQVGDLENGERDQLDENPPSELRGLVRNLNILLRNERQRYTKYRTTLSDLTHSLKTPLAVLQTTLRSLRSGKQTTIEEAEPIMLEQIGRISQQIGYYLHRASINSGQTVLTREIHSVPALLDSLSLALNKVYQRKGVVITLDISPEVTFIGEKNDFMEVMGNVLENACKYCLEFVEVTTLHSDEHLTLMVDDDGPGIPQSKRTLIFQRGQRVDTLSPGQGLGLSVAAEIIEQYDGEITIADSPLGGARMMVTFARQYDTHGE